ACLALHRSYRSPLLASNARVATLKLATEHASHWAGPSQGSSKLLVRLVPPHPRIAPEMVRQRHHEHGGEREADTAEEGVRGGHGCRAPSTPRAFRSKVRLWRQNMARRM